jgi:hypothetical protein
MRGAAAGAGAAGCMRLLLLAICAARAAASTVYATSVMQCAFKQEWSRESAALFALAHVEPQPRCSEVDVLRAGGQLLARRLREQNSPPGFLLAVLEVTRDENGHFKARVRARAVHAGDSRHLGHPVCGQRGDQGVRLGARGDGHGPLSAEYAVVVLWYLAIIDAPVQEHVRKSILEYLDVLQGDICAASAG